MHLHLFPPPPFPLMPILLASALAFAAGVFLTRRGIPQSIAGLGEGFGERLCFWRRHRQCSGSTRFSSREAGDRNLAFDEYRRTALTQLEAEAQEFRAFLEGLKRASDAAHFESFLKSRRETGPLTS